jgi:hypothetical protein
MHTFNPPTGGQQFLVPCVDLPPGSGIYCNLKKKKDNWKNFFLLQNREVKNCMLASLYLFCYESPRRFGMKRINT